MKIAVDIDNTIIDYRELIIKYLKKHENDFLKESQLKPEISIWQNRSPTYWRNRSFSKYISFL